MKKIILAALVFFLFFFVSSVSYASFNFSSLNSLRAFLGGKIIDTTAIPIQQAQDEGYVCTMTGTSISITPFGGGPTDYLIPFNVAPKTTTTPNINQYILGIYSTVPTPITCTNPSGATTVVNLDSISYFGTSKL